MGADPRIPYDRTDPMQQVPTPPGPDQGGAPQMPPGAPDLGAAGGLPPDPMAGGLLGGGDGGLGGQPPDGGAAGADLQGLGGAEPGGMDTDQLTGADLASLADQGQMSPEDLEIQQIDQALNDPNTPPEVRAQLQQLMDLAARRRMIEMGGQQGQPQLGGGLAG